MPQKRPGSPYYQVRRRNLLGVGDTGVLTTKTKSKALARRMEQALVDVAERALIEPSYREVLDAVVRKDLSLPDLLSAHTAGKIGDVRTALVDPPLAECVERYVQQGKDQRQRQKRASSCAILTGIAPARARLSYLREPKQVLQILQAAERGEPARADGTCTPRHRNTVRRYIHRAISLILRAELGHAERDRVMKEVRFPAVDDTREVELTAADVARLLEACETWEAKRPGTGYRDLAVAIRLMLQTSADRGVLFYGRTGNKTEPSPGLTVSQVKVWASGVGAGERYEGEVFLADTKAASRKRTIPLTDSTCRALIPLLAGKAPEDQVFGITYPMVDIRWKRVRTTAGLEHVRIKDLRAQTSIAAELAGVPQTVTQRVLGHSDAKMTRRYQQREAAMTTAQAEAIEEQLGLTG